MKRGLRWLPALIISLGLLWQAFAASRLTPWQAAEQARLGRHWRQAYTLYRQQYDQGDQRPAILQQLAELNMIRGEWASAETWLRNELQQPLTPQEHDLAWLAFGWIQSRQGRYDLAEQAWQAVSPDMADCVTLLQVDQHLAQGDIAGATALINTLTTVPPDFEALWILLRAELSLLSTPEKVEPLLHTAAAEPRWAYLRSDPAAFQASATTLLNSAELEPEQRTLALARVWRDSGLPVAALVLYGQITPTSVLYGTASVESVRLRWVSAGAVAAQQELRERMQVGRATPELQRLAALLAASQGDLDAANTALAQAIGANSPNSEDFVTTAALALASQDFNTARQAYIQAEALAPISGTYALQAAQFYAGTPLLTCTEGRNAARQAIATPMEAAARLTLADLALRCDDPTEALSATAPLAAQLSADPAWQTLHGSALWRLGFPQAGGWYLTQAADAAPASDWRRRAEALLGPP